MAIQNAKSVKELGLKSSEVNKIKKLFAGTKKEAGVGARAISEETNISRRKVMKALELEGLTSFSAGSYN